MATGWSCEGLASDWSPSSRIIIILFNTSVRLVVLVIFLVAISVGLIVLMVLMLWLVVMLFLVSTIVVFRVAAAVYIG